MFLGRLSFEFAFDTEEQKAKGKVSGVCEVSRRPNTSHYCWVKLATSHPLLLPVPGSTALLSRFQRLLLKKEVALQNETVQKAELKLERVGHYQMKALSCLCSFQPVGSYYSRAPVYLAS